MSNVEGVSLCSNGGCVIGSHVVSVSVCGSCVCLEL